ncbi:hypothetical protein ACFX2I_047283 [Malus domestica]
MDRVRTSSSYPDMRQQEPSWNVVRDERWRSHDDTHVAGYRIPKPGSDPQHQLHRRHRSWHEEPAEVLAQEELAEVQARVGCVLRTKNIPVNTFVIPAEQVSSSHAQIQVIQSYSPPPSSPRRPERSSKASIPTAMARSPSDNVLTALELKLRTLPPHLPPPSLASQLPTTSTTAVKRLAGRETRSTIFSVLLAPLPVNSSTHHPNLYRKKYN